MEGPLHYQMCIVTNVYIAISYLWSFGLEMASKIRELPSLIGILKC